MSNVPQDPRIDQLIETVDALQEKLIHVSKESEGLTWNNRNWEAVKLALEMNEKRFKTFETQIESVKNLVMSLQTQFQAFQQQRAIELQNMVNYGATQRDEETND